jgi:hypothetical protein
MVVDSGPLEQSMAEVTDALVLDLVEWVACEPRPYSELMEAWRTSCPRLTVWEDSVDRGFLVRRPRQGGEAMIEVTPAGLRLLEEAGRLPAGRAPRRAA